MPGLQLWEGHVRGLHAFLGFQPGVVLVVPEAGAFGQVLWDRPNAVRGEHHQPRESPVRGVPTAVDSLQAGLQHALGDSGGEVPGEDDGDEAEVEGVCEGVQLGEDGPRDEVQLLLHVHLCATDVHADVFPVPQWALASEDAAGSGGLCGSLSGGGLGQGLLLFGVAGAASGDAVGPLVIQGTVIYTDVDYPGVGVQDLDQVPCGHDGDSVASQVDGLQLLVAHHDGLHGPDVLERQVVVRQVDVLQRGLHVDEVQDRIHAIRPHPVAAHIHLAQCNLLWGCEGVELRQQP
mmetsp:Transcript_19667/g.34949  ORF Transcript_19667/g.34949 Transcript_19667/m.34949 type:complete len:291 (+) Transcript_19667:1709-2581(+)